MTQSIARVQPYPPLDPNWHPMFLPCGVYRGWQMELIHIEDGNYKAEVRKMWTFEVVTSYPKTFTAKQKEGAIAYMKGLIDWDEDFYALG